MEGSWPQAEVTGTLECARCEGAAGETAQQGEGGPWTVSKARALDKVPRRGHQTIPRLRGLRTGGAPKPQAFCSQQLRPPEACPDPQRPGVGWGLAPVTRDTWRDILSRRQGLDDAVRRYRASPGRSGGRGAQGREEGAAPLSQPPQSSLRTPITLQLPSP